MLRLRDPDAAAMLARMHARHRAALLIIESSGEPPVQSSLGRQRHGGPGGQPPFDYQAWVDDLAAWLATAPRTCAEIADRYGLVRGTVRERLRQARRLGCWPPEGMREVRLRDSYGPPRLTLVEAA